MNGEAGKYVFQYQWPLIIVFALNRKNWYIIIGLMYKWITKLYNIS